MKTYLWSNVLLLAAAGLYGQQPERVTVPFSDASHARMVRVHLLNGTITVKGYDGKDVIVEATAGGALFGPRSHGQRQPDNIDGLRRIDNPNAGVDIREENNVITIGGPMSRNGNLTIEVPYETSLQLKSLSGGGITVEHVSGEIDANDLNGSITLTGVSGSVVAHSLNGQIAATIDRLTAGKATSFSTLNGNIDVTLPADVKANVKMKSDNGDVYSDFDIKLNASNGQPVVEDGRGKGGKYRVKMERTMAGTINGGGGDLQFTTFNGNIMIRKKK
ncbi:MAG: DUF4097 family beta strand repeat-containing protein [Bryobacteraceae bacterium]